MPSNADSPSRPRYAVHLGLFLLTVASVVFTGAVNAGEGSTMAALTSRAALRHGGAFAGTLLTILLAHEFGHYIAARLHKVDATLPFFIPLPVLSPFGTMGAIIKMRDRITSRKALLDIGASGPLAGLALAIPLYVYGAAHSRFVPAGGPGMMELGESVMLKVLDRLATGAAPPGMELELSPVAYAAWAGMFVTMINLIPVGQLDGGHVAYALFGRRQNVFAQWVHRATLAFFFVNLVGFVSRDLRAGLGFVRFGTHVGNSSFWLVWFEMLSILGTLSASQGDKKSDDLGARPRIVATVALLVLSGLGRERGGTLVWLGWGTTLVLLLAMERMRGSLRPHALLDHPPTGEHALGPGRRAVAIVTLVIFALLFMPTPVAM
jgi:membrane-associated protease RseP (regulator of RpoE activity)